MNAIKISIALLFAVAILELSYGVILTTSAIDEACLDETLVVPYWFIIKGYILFTLASLMHIYMWLEYGSKCNNNLSVVIWMFIFGHLAWVSLGCNVFWKCHIDAILWVDIVLNYFLFVYQIKLLFDIHQMKNNYVIV